MRHGPPLDAFTPPTIELAERSLRACTRARESVRAASELVRTCRTQREEREHWRLLEADRRANPDRFLSCCVYCARMRTSAEEWVTIPRQVGQLLRDWNVPFLSHGICPECLDRHLPPERRQLLATER
jgi:hypothetical protein